MSSFDFVYAFLTALKLITVQNAPGWDLAQVRQDLEFDKFLERQVRDMEYMVERRRNRRRFMFGNWAAGAAPESMDGVVAPDEVEEEDPFLKLAKKIRVFSRMMVGVPRLPVEIRMMLTLESNIQREELHNEYATTQLTLAAEAVSPMTVTDAEGLMHNLEISMWGDPMDQDWEGELPLDGIQFFGGPFS